MIPEIFSSLQKEYKGERKRNEFREVAKWNVNSFVKIRKAVLIDRRYQIGLDRYKT